jgi:hypothetical protein
LQAARGNVNGQDEKGLGYLIQAWHTGRHRGEHAFHISIGEPEHGQEKTGVRRTLSFPPAFEHDRRRAPALDELQEHFQSSAADHVYSGHFGVRHVEGNHHGAPRWQHVAGFLNHPCLEQSSADGAHSPAVFENDHSGALRSGCGPVAADDSRQDESLVIVQKSPGNLRNRIHGLGKYELRTEENAGEAAATEPHTQSAQCVDPGYSKNVLTGDFYFW